MRSTVLGAALVLGALMFLGAGLPVQADGEPVERDCQFHLNVPVILEVGPCVPTGCLSSSIQVSTNTRTKVCFSTTDFTRHERDCDGRQLKTIDRIPAVLHPSFKEIVVCEDGGAPLQVKKLREDNCWCVNPHRGGFEIDLLVTPGKITICDDAGCYTANVKVLIFAEPFEQCDCECELP